MITSRYAKLYIEQDMLSHKGMISIGPGLHTYSISSSGFGFLGRFSDQLRKAFDAKIPHANLKKVLWERVFFSPSMPFNFKQHCQWGAAESQAVFFLHLNAHEDLTRVSSMMLPVEISVLNAHCKSLMLLICPLLSLLKHRIRCYDCAVLVLATSTGMFTNFLTSLSKCLGATRGAEFWNFLEIKKVILWLVQVSR